MLFEFYNNPVYRTEIVKSIKTLRLHFRTNIFMKNKFDYFSFTTIEFKELK